MARRELALPDRRHGEVQPSAARRALRRVIFVAAAATLLPFAAGCASAASLAGREYLSTAISDGGAPKALVAGTRITLRFDDRNVSASAGCNSMGGAYRIDAGKLVVDSMGMTAMGCDQALATQDQWLIGILQGRPTLTQTGDELVVEGSGAVIRLLDRRIADPDRPLAGKWTLESIVTGATVSSVPNGVVASLMFNADGTVDVDTGCNQGSGRWRAVGGGLEISGIGITKKACAESVAAVEAAVLAVLQEGTVSATIRADVLSLRSGPTGIDLRAR